MRVASYIRHTDPILLGTAPNDRRCVLILWVLDQLSKHGKIIKLQLGFSVHSVVRIQPRDRDFLIALRSVKTDQLTFGDPRLQLEHGVDVCLSQFLFPPVNPIFSCFNIVIPFHYTHYSVASQCLIRIIPRVFSEVQN